MKSGFLVMPLAILAGCNRSVDAKDAKPSEVAEKVTDAAVATRMRPGAWTYSSKVETFEMAGLPPTAVAAMKSARAEQDVGICLTEEDVAKPDASLFGQTDKSCKFDRFSMDGGKLAYQMTCKRERGGDMHARVDGTYSPEHFAMSMRSTTEFPGVGPDLNMTVNIVGKRTGECKIKEDAQ